MMKMKARPLERFSLVKRGKSIGYAKAGLQRFFREEHNARLHLLATVLVLTGALFLGVTPAESLVLLLVTGLVWAAELFNTALEKTLDLLHPEKHPAVKYCKDLSAAAVAILALVALLCGAIVFIPKLILIW